MDLSSYYLTKGEADWHTKINSALDAINSNFEELETANTDRGKYTELCEWDTYTSGTITLTDSIANYKYIVIRAGANTASTQGGGRTEILIPVSMIVQDGELISTDDKRNLVYQQDGAINSITFIFTSLNTITITNKYSTGTFSSGIRQVYGLK